MAEEKKSFVSIPNTPEAKLIETTTQPMENPIMSLQEEKEGMDEYEVREESTQMAELVAHIKHEFERSKNKRRFDEERWLQCYRNYRGFYGPDVQFTDTEKSQAFIKITKTKVNAAYAQLTEILFGTTKFPIGIEPSPVPEGILEAVHWDPKAPENQMPEGEDGGEEEVAQTPTVARKDILELIGSSVKKQVEKVADKLKEGAGKTPTSYTYEPAKVQARKLEKEMLDQLEEANARKSLRNAILEQCLFGSGVYKGPFAYKKEYSRWSPDGKYDPIMKTIPDFSQVSLWDAYPDADARNMDEAELFIQRHRMNKTQLRALKRRPGFRVETIEQILNEGPNYRKEYWEDSLYDEEDTLSINRWEVLEFWGIIDKEIAEETGIEIPKELEDRDQVQINAWICGDYILRVVLNPFTPARIPYYIIPYELNPYSIFGIGVAENMFDTQLAMNGSFRLMIDNAVLSANLAFEVNETNLVPGQDMKLYPGKIFRTEGQLGQAIKSIKWDNVTQECLMMFDKARQLADEATGMPSYAHGMSGIQSTGRTASGMSMLMGAAKENIKSVVRNIDDFLLIPMGKALFAFNMQFNFSEDYIGDLDVVARGTESLMRSEMRSQKILQFYQITSNPADMPWVKRDYLLRELAADLDLDPEKVVNDPRAAAIQAEMLKEMQQRMGVDPSQQQAQASNPAAVPQASDPTGTGGGNIAPGQAPEPGSQGNTGAGGGDNGGQQPQQQGMM